MAHLNTEDAVLYAAGQAEKTAFENYHRGDFDELRKHYYAVFMHGDKEGAHIWDNPQHFAPILKGWHKNFGEGRSVLLMTCWAGWNFARPLAVSSGIPILAGLSGVTIRSKYQYGKENFEIKLNEKFELEFYGLGNEKFRTEWQYLRPDGSRSTLVCNAILDHAEAIRLAKPRI